MKNSFYLLTVIVTLFFTASCKENPKTETPSTTLAAPANAIIVDVRSTEEYQNEGKADCTINIPLDELENRKEELRKYDQITVVCLSGGRSSQAADLLKDAGFTQTINNAGSWKNIQCK
jgi:phage shock protein E